MKISLLIYCSFFIISLNAFGQNGSFSEHAFLNIYSNDKAIVYKDSISKESILEIQNNFEKDNYYLFEIQKKYKTRVKINGKQTIDARNLDSASLSGWIDIHKLFIFYNKNRAKYQSVYFKPSRYAGKKMIPATLLTKPIQIIDVVFVGDEMWFKVLININKKSSITGWMPSELQCTDIWNACL